ncbi:Nicotinamidase-like amidase [Candidatus Terasakiella magnetica]|uniref:Nicotinamidase-like amidase n=1 Tax=Candidatus Terasakiella magnetica TaxID=1867952 RepID=A0A1C3REL9_9PROT|nr:cysteine hydrolase family protein [Candidatus Terasakiella magnetica]SCA55740.1 Nicotinamidase-like amidase [Candidatus Terasakiella magnetica]
MDLDATTALVIVDVQQALNEPEMGELNNPEFTTRILDLLTLWRARHWPVFHVKHTSHEPTSPYFSLSPSCEFIEKSAPVAGEPVVGKEYGSAFLNTALGSMLRMDGCEKLVVCGAYTHNTVDATVRHAAGLKFDTYVVSDACSAASQVDMLGREWKGEDVHQLALSVLNGDYAQVVSMQDIFACI